MYYCYVHNRCGSYIHTTYTCAPCACVHTLTAPAIATATTVPYISSKFQPFVRPRETAMYTLIGIQPLLYHRFFFVPFQLLLLCCVPHSSLCNTLLVSSCCCCCAVYKLPALIYYCYYCCCCYCCDSCSHCCCWVAYTYYYSVC
jgi:hypothetical protein